MNVNAEKVYFYIAVASGIYKIISLGVLDRVTTIFLAASS